MITIENLSIRMGTFRLKDISFEVPDGKYGVLMGRTGCGKTTILEAVCGLKPIRGGTIRLAGVDVTDWKSARRGIGYVPQDGALFKTMTVRAHLAFALRIRRWSQQRVAVRVQELSDLLGISHLLDRKPQGLSGGEQQRVALGRALSFRPHILCLDEPLSALDADTRGDMCSLLKRVQQETGVTTLHVTHNRWEAERLADQLLEYVNGQVRVVTTRTGATKHVPDDL